MVMVFVTVFVMVTVCVPAPDVELLVVALPAVGEATGALFG